MYPHAHEHVQTHKKPEEIDDWKKETSYQSGVEEDIISMVVLEGHSIVCGVVYT